MSLGIQETGLSQLTTFRLPLLVACGLHCVGQDKGRGNPAAAGGHSAEEVEVHLLLLFLLLDLSTHAKTDH